MCLYQSLADALQQLEVELQQLGLWQEHPPSPQALASQQPFCIDTLEFNQWLQYVFLPRMQQLIATRSSLPARCNIAPMAEEFFKLIAPEGHKVVELLKHIDCQLQDAAR